MANKKPVVVVGSINMDLVAGTERIPIEGETVTGYQFQVHPGGKGANQAVAVAQLGYPVHMIGRVGNDAFGSQLKAHLEEAGVDVTAVATSAGSSGVAMIFVADSGANVIVVVPGANAAVTPADIDANIDVIRSAGIVLAQLEIPIETISHLAKVCKREGIDLVLDPAPAQDLPSELLAQVAWMTPNETEAAFYVGESLKSQSPNHTAATVQKLVELGAKDVVLKLGSRGAYVASSSEPPALIPSFAVKAIDTTAAGDCFNGAFAVGLMTGKSAVESARFAAAAAAISVTRAGAQPSMPTLSEVEKLLETTGSIPGVHAR